MRKEAVLYVYCFYVTWISALDSCHFGKHTDERGQDRLEPLMGKRYVVRDLTEGPDSYIYYVGICTTGLGPGDIAAEDQRLSSAGVLQTSRDNPKDLASWKVVGSLESVEIKDGSNWILLEYKDGDQYHSHCQSEKRQANIMVICKEGEAGGNLKLIVENTNKTGNCYYLFELEHEAACQLSKDASGFSVGSILIITLFCVSLVYLIGGMAYQRFVNGAKGIEQIPNLNFWRDFGNLQADGCNFLCRSGSYNKEPRSYRGIGDDQLQDEDDDDLRDEHLLPM